jgi:TPP-dependent trihydroxycyclohexane-1,2-dione (THcHDO) dehydratase
MLAAAIARVLASPHSERAELFLHQVREIEAFMAAHPQERPWTCTVWTGTDGSRIFRGGVGHSLVIDVAGRLWRARSYEDFHTEYAFTQNSCEIASLTPIYAQMREYLPRTAGEP